MARRETKGTVPQSYHHAAKCSLWEIKTHTRHDMEMLFICRPQNAICMHANVQPDKFSPCQIPTSQPTFYTPEKTTQKFFSPKVHF
jgi:hypothetical protein